jgi:hypothetical protein
MTYFNFEPPTWFVVICTLVIAVAGWCSIEAVLWVWRHVTLIGGG